MKATVYHLQINVSDLQKSVAFYQDLLGYFGYEAIHKDKYAAGFSNGTTDFWLVHTGIKYQKNQFHRKNIGLNHIAFRVNSKDDVDKFCEEFLKPKKIAALYNSPRKFPEYTDKYYAVYFEDPDRIKLEVVYL